MDVASGHLSDQSGVTPPGEIEDPEWSEAIQLQGLSDGSIECHRGGAVDDDLNAVLKPPADGRIHSQVLLRQVAGHHLYFALHHGGESVAVGFAQAVESAGRQNLALKALLRRHNPAVARDPFTNEEMHPADAGKIAQDLLQQGLPY